MSVLLLCALVTALSLAAPLVVPRALRRDARRWDGAEPGRALEPSRRRLRATRRELGWAACWVAVAVGSTLIVLAYHIARTTTNLDYVALYWVGFAIGLSGLIGAVLVSRRGWRGMAFALALGVWTFLPKLLMSRHGPVYFDEWGHFRHLRDLGATGDIFGPDPFLPIVKYFPGLSVVSYAVEFVTRSSAWTAAVLTSVGAHAATLAAVHRIAQRLGLSPRRCVVATVLYAIGPNYTFFDAQYAYETLGLALAFWTVASALGAIELCAAPSPPGRSDDPAAKNDRRRFARHIGATGVLGIGTVFTHHLSALVASAILVGLVVAIARLAVDPRRRAALAAVAALCAVTAVVWVGVVADSSSYISGKATSGVHQLLQIIGLASTPGGTHAGSAGRSVLSATTAPRYEIVCGYASIVALALAFGTAVVGLWARRRRERGLRARPRWAFAVLGAFFFLSLPLVLTSTGAEIAHRSWAFSWLGLATTLASMARPSWTTPRPRAAVAIAGGVLLVLAIGMAVDGTNTDYRFPGPYKFGSDARSRNPDEYRLARWFDRTGRRGGVITDRFTGSVLTGYTELVIPLPTQQQLYRVFTDPLRIPPDVTTRMRQWGYSYVVVDANFEGRLPAREEFYPGADSYYPVDQSGLATLLRRRGSAQLTLIERIGHYFVFRLI